MTLTWTWIWTTQPTMPRKTLTFILRHLLRTSPKFAGFFTAILPSHSGPAHSRVGGAGPAASLYGAGTPRSRGPAEHCIPRHTAPLSRAGLLSWANMLSYKHRKPCTMCSGPSPEGLWWTSPIMPPHQTMPRGWRPHTHTVKAEPRSQRLMPLCSQ